MCRSNQGFARNQVSGQELSPTHASRSATSIMITTSNSSMKRSGLHTLINNRLLESRRGGFNDEPRWRCADVKERAGSVEQGNECNWCSTVSFRSGIHKRHEDSEQDVCGGKSPNRGCSESALGEGKGQKRKGKGRHDAQEANHVGQRSSEDCSRATCSVGESESR